MYFIGHVIDGEAREYQRALIDELSRVFGIRNNNLRLEPHITIKAPFEFENIEEVENIIEEMIVELKSSEYKIEGFAHFNKRVVFLKVFESQMMVDVTRELQKKLRSVKRITFSAHEGKENIDFHATLCYSDRFNFEKIFNFLSQKTKPSFKQRFNNITIFIKKGNRWEIYRRFDF